MTRTFGLRASPERKFESLYQRHVAEVYRYALVMLDSPVDAEDVTQTTFLNAYRALLRGERPREPGRWLRVITHNLCLQHFRQAARRPRQVELEDDTEGVVSDEQGVRVDDLVRALRQIPVSQRAALVMRELEGRPIAEIAGVLGVSVSAVETLLFRARRSVREQLEGSLTCAEAEQAISRQLDGSLPRAERGALRAHVRQCEECAHLARSLRAQRGAIKSLGAISLPVGLAWSKFGTGAAVSGVASAGAGTAASGGAWLVGSLTAKLAGATLLTALAAGVSYEAAVNHPWTTATPAARVRVRAPATAQRDGAREPGQPATSAPTPKPRGHAQSVDARGIAPATAAARPGASTRTSPPHATGPFALTVPSPAYSHAAAGNPHGSTKAGGSHGRSPTHSAQPKRTHPSKPTHSSKPTHPAKPTHPSKPTPPKHHASNPSQTSAATGLGGNRAAR
jgi:RNA polymerase sigma factor (sigma-70 family)